jgi:indole-3-glycerol phosphate synthase
MLIKMIEEYNLAELDQQGVAMIEQKDKMLKQGEKAIDAPAQASAGNTVIISDVKKTAPEQVVIKDKKEEKPARAEYVVNGVRALKAIGNEDPLKIAFEYNLDYSYVMSFQ